MNGEGRGAEPDQVGIAPGTTLAVASGTLRLEQESGCVMLLQGPAEVVFPAPERPDLRSGSLVVLGDPIVEAQYSHYLVTDRDDVASARARLFAEYLLRALDRQ